MKILTLFSLVFALNAAEKSGAEILIADQAALAKELRASDVAAFVVPDAADGYFLYLIDDHAQEALVVLEPIARGEENPVGDALVTALGRLLLEKGLKLPDDSTRAEFLSRSYFRGAILAQGDSDADAHLLGKRFLEVVDAVDFGLPAAGAAEPEADKWKPYLAAVDCTLRARAMTIGSKDDPDAEWAKQFTQLQKDWRERRQTLVDLCAQQGIGYGKSWCSRIFAAMDKIAKVSIE